MTITPDPHEDEREDTDAIWCDWCHDLIVRPEYAIDRGRQIYCSRRCDEAAYYDARLDDYADDSGAASPPACCGQSMTLLVINRDSRTYGCATCRCLTTVFSV